MITDDAFTPNAASIIDKTVMACTKFSGKYEAKVPPIEISVEVVGGLLELVVPGQPVYTLTPVSPVRFRIESAPAGFFVQFEMADSKVKSVTIEQGPTVSLKLLPK